MLRSIKTPYPGLRLVPGKMFYTGGVGGTPGFSQFKSCFNAVTDVDWGYARYTLADQSASLIGSLCTPERDGFLMNTQGVLTASQVNNRAYNFGAGNDDTDFHTCAILLDQRSPRYNKRGLTSVETSMVDGEIIALNLNTTTPSIVDGNPSARDITITKNGTGDVTVTFTNGFQQPVIAIATARANTATVSAHSATRNSIRFERFNQVSNANEDGTFYAFVFGTRSKYEGYGIRRAIKNARLRPIMFPFRFTASALDIGGEALTAGTIGSGSYQATFNTPFAVPPVVAAIASSPNARYASVDASTTTLTCYVSNEAGTLTHTSGSWGVTGLVLGWMDDTVCARF